MTPATQTRVGLAAMVATLLVALTLSPLIQGLGWFVATFVVLALITGSGIAVRQLVRQWPVVVAAQVVVGALALTSLFVRDSALWGVLPGPDALGALRELLDNGMRVTRDDAPPVEATRGLILLATGGVSLVGLAVDVIAVSLRRPAVAGLPLLAVYCVPTAVLPGGLSWPYFALAGVGFLVLVGADAADRVRGWGRVLGTPDAAGLDASAPLHGARRVGAACLAIAVVVPALVPGLGQRLIGNGAGLGPGNGNGSTIRVINPILDLRKNLGARSNTVVIRFRADDQSPIPLRIVTDDVFDGSLWAPSSGTLAGSQRVQSGLPNPPPGLDASVPSTNHTMRIDVVGPLEETYLPLPYPTTKVDIGGTWLWDADTLNVVGWGTTTAKGLSYTAYYRSVAPSAAQLESAPAPPAAVVQRDTKLPAHLPASISRTARTVAGTGSSYQRAVALQAWFRSGGGFTYSDTLPGDGRSDSSESAVARFLTQKVGYCVQFASAMAVMARTLGIPARVAVGFLPGTRGSDGSYSVSLRDAHAWPELYFGGVGWVRFEPTPATRTGAAPAWTVPLPATALPQPSTTATAPAPGHAATPAPDGGAQQPSATTGTSLLVRLWGGIPWRVVGVLALLLLALAAPRFAAAAVRRRRWRRATTPQGRAEAAWDELHDRLSDLGVSWGTAWTPRGLQHRLAHDHGLGDAPLAAMSRLVDDLERARYARPEQVSRPAGERVDDVSQVIRAVTGTVEARVRRLAWLFPRSGLAALVRVARGMDAAADQATQRASTLRHQVRRAVGGGGSRT